MATIRGSTQNNGTATTLVLTPEAGTASGDILVAFLTDDATARTLTAPDGTWTAIQSYNAGPFSGASFYKVLSAAPAANYTFSGFAGGGSNVNAGTLTSIALGGESFNAITSSVANQDVAGTVQATTAVTGVTDPSILLCAWMGDDSVTVSSAPSGMTLEEAVEPGATLALETYSQVNPGTGSLTKSLTWSGSTQTIAIAALFDLTASAGPTIDTQPTAATVRVNGDPTNTATFTVAATTSGGTLVYDWELEDGVGAGTYTNVANGNGATWTGATGASLVGTFTANTLSGRRVRCNVSDDNGTTTTTAVAVTVYTGPVLSVASGTGAGTFNLTSDEVLGTGYSYRVTVTPTGTPSAAKRSHGRSV